MPLSHGIPEACGYVCWQFLVRYDAMPLSSGMNSWSIQLCVLALFIRYDAMPLSGGIPGWGISLCVLAI